MIEGFKSFINKEVPKPTGWVNQSNLEHGFFAVVMQLVTWLITGDLLAGTCFGIAFFLGREHAQAQDKIGYTLAKTFKAFDLRLWSRDAIMDLMVPVVLCLLVLIFKTLVF